MQSELNALAKDAHASTVQENSSMAAGLDWADEADFDNARRGFVASNDNAEVVSRDGKLVWSMKPYAFLQGQSSITVNPSLWRQARLNAVHGLFKVCDHIYQVRGYDIANITFIEGTNGLIIIDPLTFEEPARAALQLYEKHVGKRPVLAVIYSHSHRDHYGGVKGVINEEDVHSGRVDVIAPNGFMEEVLSEAVMAGVPARRRAEYQFGTYLTPGPRGHVDSGNGKAIGKGTSGLIPPTKLISRTGERMTIDGVEIEFQLTPGTEAPVEMNFYFPQFRALNLAENACHTMHNLCPMRGAKVRDALAWAKYLDESVELFSNHVDVCFAQHQWPTWGRENIVSYLSDQRDMYRYMHDQTLRLMSQGLTATEIAHELMLPTELARKWHARGYYGAVAHNVQAIYAFYMGPYDGNPATLNVLPPEASAKKYIEYMGGAQAALRQAMEDYSKGEFRWVAQVMSHAVFADPGNQNARKLCADAFEQLAYQSEAATWRNAYLVGAKELREGVTKRPTDGNSIPPTLLAQLPLPLLLDYLAIRINGPASDKQELLFDFCIESDAGVETRKVTLRNGVLSHSSGSHGPNAQATLTATRQVLRGAFSSRNGLVDAVDSAALAIHGDTQRVRYLFENLEVFDYNFNIVEP